MLKEIKKGHDEFVKDLCRETMKKFFIDGYYYWKNNMIQIKGEWHERTGFNDKPSLICVNINFNEVLEQLERYKNKDYKQFVAMAIISMDNFDFVAIGDHSIGGHSILKDIYNELKDILDKLERKYDKVKLEEKRDKNFVTDIRIQKKSKNEPIIIRICIPDLIVLRELGIIQGELPKPPKITIIKST